MTPFHKLLWMCKRGIALIVASIGQVLWVIRPVWGFLATQKLAVTLGHLTAKYKKLQYMEYSK